MNKNQNQTTIDLKTLLKDPLLYIGASVFLLIVFFLVLVIPKYNQFKETEVALQKVNLAIDGDKTTGKNTGIAFDVKKKEMALLEHKKNVDSLMKKDADLYAKVFPENEEIYALTELLERFAVDHNSQNNPFILNNINFGNLQEPQVNTAEGALPSPPPPSPYGLIQINLPLEVSEENFYKFLDFIKKSGSIEVSDFYHGDRPVPLMTIESLNYSYIENPENPELKKINATFVLNTYVRITATTPETTPDSNTKTTENLE